MITERIKAMLEACEAGDPRFPPTVLFSEGWLLRVVLDWFAAHGGERDPFAPAPGGRWFSESWLPSAFLARYRGDELAESRTHADGVVGHFVIGEPGTAGLRLAADAKQLVMVEAKLYGRLSAGVRNAPGYDQAARTVACMAEVLRRAGREPDELKDLAFIVIAPLARVEDGVFARQLGLDSIRRTVRARVDSYNGGRDPWFRDWFEPTLQRVDIRCLGWEDAIETIAFHDPAAGQFIDSFYGKCLRFNRARDLAAFPGRRTRSNRPLEFERARAEVG